MRDSVDPTQLLEAMRDPVDPTQLLSSGRHCCMHADRLLCSTGHLPGRLRVSHDRRPHGQSGESGRRIVVVIMCDACMRGNF